MDKYLEALERAKQGLPIEEVFPELKESRLVDIIKSALQSYFDGKLSEGTNDADYAMCLTWLGKQKVFEWNEEDNRIYDDIVGAINSTNWGELDKKVHINRLKSLKPQKQWKPSIKQMDTLEYLCSHSSLLNPDVMHVLESLYNDLKKL